MLSRYFSADLLTQFYNNFAIFCTTSVLFYSTFNFLNLKFFSHTKNGISKLNDVYSIIFIFKKTFSLYFLLLLIFFIYLYISRNYSPLQIISTVCCTILYFLLKLNVSSLNLESKHNLAVLVEGPIFFPSCAVILTLSKNTCFTDLSVYIASIFSLCLSLFISNINIVKSNLNLNLVKKSSESLTFFNTSNAYLRSIFDNWVPIFVPMFYTSNISSLIIICWKLSQFILFPFLSIQGLVSVELSKCVHSGSSYLNKLWYFTSKTLPLSLLIAIILFIVHHFGTLDLIYAQSIPYIYLYIFSFMQLLIVLLGPVLLIAELLSNGKIVFLFSFISFLIFIFIGSIIYKMIPFCGFLSITVSNFFALFKIYNKSIR